MKKFIFVAIAASLLSCSQQKTKQIETTTLSGNWLGELALNDSTNLNFIFKIVDDGPNINTTLINGTEQIKLQTSKKGDTIIMNFPVYQSRLIATAQEGLMLGCFEKTDAKDYRVPFVASQGLQEAIPNNQAANAQLAPRYAATFFGAHQNSPAIGEFKQNENRVTGSFLTPYGDYRYLSGKLNGNQLVLFGFDGGFLQVFKAEYRNDSLVNGHYYSGLTGYNKWQAYPSNEFSLENPETMTVIKTDLGPITFAFPNLEGDTTRYTQGETQIATILQITGSWCPNCKDQAVFLQQLATTFGADLQIIGLAFERMGTLEASIAAAKKSKTDLGVNYPVCIAKYSKEQIAEEQFPFVEKIRSYPTLIFIDKQGNIAKIYTGFAGPGTTQYDDVVAYLTQYTQSLVNE